MFDRFNKYPEAIRRISRGLESKFDLFPGVSKPSVTLCYMLVAYMLKQIDTYVNIDYCDITVKFDKFTIRFRHDRDKRKSDGTFHALSFNGLNFNIPEVAEIYNGQSLFGDEEKIVLVEGFKKFYVLYQTSQRMKAAHDAQQLAVNIIDKLFNHKREGDEDVHSTDGSSAA